MKKKNNAVGTFPQRFLACLSKLKDNATIATSHQQIRELLQQHDLQDISNIYQLLDNTENVTDKARKEYVKVYASLCEIYGQAVFDNFQRMLTSLFRKMQFGQEVADSISVLAQLFKDFDYDQQIRCTQMLLKHITATNNYSSMGMCLRALVRALSRTMVGYFQDFLIDLVLEKLPIAKQKQPLLESLLSLILALEEDFSSRGKIEAVLLGWIKDQDWNVRRVSIDIYYTIIVLKGLEGGKEILRAVEQAKYDKIKNVRDAATNCLNVIKELGGINESPRFVEEQPIKTPNRTSKATSKQENSSKQSGTNVIGPTRPISKSIASNTRTLKNESFFKNAKQADVILTSKQQNIEPSHPHQKDPNAGVMAKKFTFQQQNQDSQVIEPRPSDPPPRSAVHNDPILNNYLRPSPDNDSLEHLANMLPVSFGEHSKYDSQADKDSLQLSNFDFGSNKSNQPIGLSKWKKQPASPPVLEEIVEMPSSNSVKAEEQRPEEPTVGWLATQFKKVLEKVVESEDRILERLGLLETRVSKVESRVSHMEQKSLRESQRSHGRTNTVTDFEPSRVKLYMTDHNESAAAIESNVDDKVKASLSDGNYAEAYGLVLANNREDTLIKLLERTGMVADQLETVHVEVLLLKLRDFISKKTRVVLCLKWIRDFLESGIPLTRTGSTAINHILDHHHASTSEEQMLVNSVKAMVPPRS